MAVLTPIKRPAESKSGPPELPGLMAASVWITSRMGMPLADWISRPSAEMMPVVSVWSKPNGLPMASTVCPTLRSAEVPSESGGNCSLGASMRSTARSFSGAKPTSSAGQVDWSASVTSARVAPWMTW
jgi:hypothetical protein